MQSVSIPFTVFAMDVDEELISPEGLSLTVSGDNIMDTPAVDVVFDEGQAHGVTVVSVTDQNVDARAVLTLTGFAATVNHSTVAVTVNTVEFFTTAELTVVGEAVRPVITTTGIETFEIQLRTLSNRNNPLQVSDLSVTANLLQGQPVSVLPAAGSALQAMTDAQGQTTVTVQVIAGASTATVLQIVLTQQSQPNIVVTTATIELRRGEVALAQYILSLEPQNPTQQLPGQEVRAVVTVLAVGTDGLPIIPTRPELLSFFPVSDTPASKSANLTRATRFFTSGGEYCHTDDASRTGPRQQGVCQAGWSTRWRDR